MLSKNVTIIIPVIIVETTKKVEVSAPVETLQVNKANEQVVVNTEVTNIVVNAPAEIKLEDGAKVEKIEVGESAKGTSITATESAKVETVIAAANCSVPGGTKVEVTNKEIEITDSKTNEKIEIPEENIIERFELTIGKCDNATASLNTKLVSEKEEATLTIVPELGYKVTKVTAGEATVGDLKVAEDGVVTTTITGVTKATEIEITVEKEATDNPDNPDTDNPDTDNPNPDTKFTITATGVTVSGEYVTYAINEDKVTGANFSTQYSGKVSIVLTVAGGYAAKQLNVTINKETTTYNPTQENTFEVNITGDATIEAVIEQK